MAHEYLDPVRAAGIDTLVLGCTHYPLLTGVISYVMGDEVTLVSSAEETAKDVYRTARARRSRARPGLPAPEHRFLATGEPERVRAVGRRFLGPELESSSQFAVGRAADEARRVLGCCAGSFPGARTPRRRATWCRRRRRRPHWSGAARPGQRRARRAAALRRPADHRTRSPVSHLHADHCSTSAGSTCCAATTPTGHGRPIPVYGPPGARPAVRRAPTAWRSTPA